MERTGLVGVGAMGSALLERLKLAGGQVVVFDIAEKAMDTARSLGAELAESSAAVAEQVKLIDVVVRNDEQMLDATLGKMGILEGAKPGTLVLLHSTISPDTTKKVAEAAKARGVEAIDACMIGVPRVVREGGLSFVVGGTEEQFERAKPHLLKMAKQALHMGPLGTGNVAKLIKNLLTGSESLIIHEAIQIGEAGGIPYTKALEMMRKTHSGGHIQRWEGIFDPSGKDPTPNAGQNVFDKDIPLAAGVGRAHNVSIPITEQLVAAGKKIVEKNKRS